MKRKVANCFCILLLASLPIQAAAMSAGKETKIISDTTTLIKKTGVEYFDSLTFIEQNLKNEFTTTVNITFSLDRTQHPMPHAMSITVVPWDPSTLAQKANAISDEFDRFSSPVKTFNTLWTLWHHKKNQVNLSVREKLIQLSIAACRPVYTQQALDDEKTLKQFIRPIAIQPKSEQAAARRTAQFIQSHRFHRILQKTIQAALF
jgi:hypothetical protein